MHNHPLLTVYVYIIHTHFKTYYYHNTNACLCILASNVFVLGALRIRFIGNVFRCRQKKGSDVNGAIHQKISFTNAHDDMSL